MITLKQLQVFAAIARHGNMNAAAKEVFLSKGAVSQALAELERRLGAPVFDRAHPHLQLNEQGRQLQPHAEEVLGRVQDILTLFGNTDAPAGQLKIGASQTIGNYMLPRLLAQGSSIQAQVFISNSYTLCSMLARFELDIALIEGDNKHPDLVSEHWLDDEMRVVAAADHPLCKRKKVSTETLQQQSWVLREPLSGNREQFNQLLQPLVQPLASFYEFNTLEAVMQGVEQGLGLTLISELAARDRISSGKLQPIHMDMRFPRTLKFIWHKNKYHSALLRRFITDCRAYQPDQD